MLRRRMVSAPADGTVHHAPGGEAMARRDHNRPSTVTHQSILNGVHRWCVALRVQVAEAEALHAKSVV